MMKNIRWKYNDDEFLTECVSKIPGWLVDYTATKTMKLLRWQENNSVEGCLFEIGVFAGRYFSILIRSSLETKSKIFGLDTFQFCDEATVRRHLDEIFLPNVNLTFIKNPSTSYTAEDLLNIFGEKARFISVDGSHEAEDVMWDLELCDQILGLKGIVAVDDFLNPMTLGVNDAVNRFFQIPRDLAPFGYVANKLFLCRPPMAQELSDILEEAIVSDENHPRSVQFVKDSKEDRNRVVARMWGYAFVNAY